MDVNTILGILVLAVLLFIAAELYVISRELSRRLPSLLKKNDDRTEKSAGQTINIHLAPTASDGTIAVPSVTMSTTPVAVNTQAVKTETKPESSGSDESSEPDKPAPVEKEITAAERKAPQSGLHSVKCLKCQAENSNYRNKCFNCGAPL